MHTEALFSEKLYSRHVNISFTLSKRDRTKLLRFLPSLVRDLEVTRTSDFRGLDGTY